MRLRCSNDTLQTYHEVNADTYVWQPLSLSSQGQINFDNLGGPSWAPHPVGEFIQPYNHYIGGVRQDGVFLGGRNGSTTWGIEAAWTPSGPPYLHHSPEKFLHGSLLWPDAQPTSSQFSAFYKIVMA